MKEERKGGRKDGEREAGRVQRGGERSTAVKWSEGRREREKKEET